MLTWNQYLLVKLAEECTEVAKRSLKQLQFGKNEIQAVHSPSQERDGDSTIPNHERTRQELNDLNAVVNLLIAAGELEAHTPEEIMEAYTTKREKLHKYYEYSLGLDKKLF